MRLSSDERFAEFRGTPGIYREAAVTYHRNPEGFLVGVREAITRLQADDRFAGFRDTPWVFRTAATTNPSDPEGFL